MTTTYKIVVNDGIEEKEVSVTVEVTPVHCVTLVSTDTHMSPSDKEKEVQNVTDGETEKEEQGEPDVTGGIAVIIGTDETMQYTASEEED